mmetsp:Transcript_29049/g.57972  ORF Transcript_29049/g.57972 Transcript_29049/m.57972 type:complete len:346 (-) Transcript_29049:179-1216(-)|eukprot:CAMPEP_0171377436 /NCGR_PEP_ID=MMETSP0879-20121228/21124_1 /TAXON_ID=67004 /ORGANISM="Thalassiosira weissflogii, Strain CCMP1336" /LENGTH=345 /DNA_ID=CAMNT_0011887563 /DNA_START=68 /DNA_END=1105 /DNA_ORIENTATION=-
MKHGYSLAACFAITAASSSIGTEAFAPTWPSLIVPLSRTSRNKNSPLVLSSSADEKNDRLEEKFGGFTVKQRLREEIESPFRQVRLFFFASSGVSAFVAFYFSALVAFKAYIGGYSDVPPLEDALQQVVINGVGTMGFGALALRELKIGKANLERIAKGGLLARLVVEPAVEGSARRTLKDYRRASRVIIAAGGSDYINRLAMSLCSDQLKDENTLPAALADVDIVIVPVLLGEDYKVVDSKAAWRNGVPGENDRNYDNSRADEIVAFPLGYGMWNDYLESDIDTAKGQGFDVLENGITITVKKNGRILRRATGLPPYGDFVSAMEVADGSRFGMPGDSERYGGQ